MNASGQVAVVALLGNPNNHDAIVRGDANGLVTIARKGQVIPGLGTIDNLTLYDISMNDGGEIAFCFSDNITNAPKALAVSSGSGNPEMVAILDTPIPTMTSRKWSAIDTAPLINNAGDVAYGGRLVNVSNGGDVRGALFLDHGVLVMTDESLPGGGGTFSSFLGTPFALNDAGQVAFKAQISLDGMPGASYGIFFHDGAGGLHEVIRRNRPFLGSTITNVDLAGNSHYDVLPKGMHGLNNAGEVAFLFHLADGREGIALWSSLPKPASGPASISAVAAGWRVRFSGIPGWSYQFQRDEDLIPPWETVPGMIRANASGVVTFDDPGPGLPPRRFYRCVEAP